MLDEAFAKIPDGTTLILHSDRGWQYQHRQYQRMLKSELLYLQEFQSMEHFKQKLMEYLDCYNNRRITANRKDLPPALHRQQALSVA